MRRYALIGWPLGHSFSAAYFAEKFAREGIAECDYRLLPIERIGMLPGLIAADPDLRGINVTIPYKEAVIPYLDGIDPEAARVGAVNCIDLRDGILTGYNTDIYGFRRSLEALLNGEIPERALVLGSGGAAKAVGYVLGGMGIEAHTVSRTGGDGRLTYDDLTPDVMASHRLIVNTTPLGTYPNTDGFPEIPYGELTPDHFLFDLVYNPPVTQFLARGAEHGARTMNGSQMLVDQAERSWEIWNR